MDREMDFFDLVLLEVGWELDGWDREHGIYSDSRDKATDAFNLAVDVFNTLAEEGDDKYYIGEAHRRVEKFGQAILMGEIER